MTQNMKIMCGQIALVAEAVGRGHLQIIAFETDAAENLIPLDWIARTMSIADFFSSSDELFSEAESIRRSSK